LYIAFAHNNSTISVNKPGWKTIHISWCVLNTTSEELGYDRTEFVKSVSNAFDEWSRTGFKFYQHEPCRCTTIISVSVQHLSHFFADIPCLVFAENEWAHGLFPPRGDIHIRSGLNLSLWYPKLNISEADFIGDDEYNISLYSIVLHEIGHSLGLSHSHLNGSVMYEWNNGKTFVLHDQDITRLQTKYNLNHNGIPNNNTYKPRTQNSSSKPLNYKSQNFWKVGKLSWCIMNRTDDELGYNSTLFLNSVFRAFEEWNRTVLEFHQHDPCRCSTNIEISVQNEHHYLDDKKCYLFGNRFAHTFTPPGGYIHLRSGLNLSLWYPPLNDTRNVVSASDNSTIWPSVYSVVLHEIGHALGLEHSSVTESVMHDHVNQSVLHLHDSDVEHIRIGYQSVILTN